MQPLWMTRAFAALSTLTRSLPPPLDARFARVRERLGRSNQSDTLEGALSSSAATPGLSLFDAYRRDLGLEEADPRVAALAEGMLCLYLHVRIQDDVVDEPALFDRPFIYLAEVFSAASARAFAQALPGEPGFFAFRERVLARFSAAAAWEIDLLHPGAASVDEERRIGEKLLPMAIPLGALSFLAGPREEADALVGVALPLATSLQVVNDLLNLPEDHLGGRPTPLLHRLYRSGAIRRESSLGEVRTALLGGDVIEHACAWSATELGRAESVANDLGRASLAGAVRERRAFLAKVPRLVTASCFEVAS